MDVALCGNDGLCTRTAAATPGCITSTAPRAACRLRGIQEGAEGWTKRPATSIFYVWYVASWAQLSFCRLDWHIRPTWKHCEGHKLYFSDSRHTRSKAPSIHPSFLFGQSSVISVAPSIGRGLNCCTASRSLKLQLSPRFSCAVSISIYVLNMFYLYPTKSPPSQFSCLSSTLVPFPPADAFRILLVLSFTRILKSVSVRFLWIPNERWASDLQGIWPPKINEILGHDEPRPSSLYRANTVHR